MDLEGITYKGGREGMGLVICRETHDTDARDSVFPFSGLSQHDIGLVLR